MNPYLNRVMLKSPDQFFGRRRELRQILSRIGTSRPQCVSIVGERRIGKSSLINALTWRETHQDYLPETIHPLLITIDIQKFPNINPKSFFQIVLDEISNAEPEGREISESSSYNDFADAVKATASESRPLIILLDEFDTVTSNPSFGTEFYSFMRSIANNHPVAYVTSSQQELQKICHSSKVADSPFFNIFSNLYLRPFSESEALDLINTPSAAEGIRLDKYSNDILALGGLFPFYLQIACSVYFDTCSENPGKEPVDRTILDHFLEEAGPHFQYLWEHSDEITRGVFRSLTRGSPIEPEDQHVAQKMTRQGYLVQEEGGYRIFSEGFVKFLSDLFSSSDPGFKSQHPVQPFSTPSLLEGLRLHQYNILSRAGEGGMGVVYSAEDEFLKRKVALKFCRNESGNREHLKKRIFQEARLVASISHPAVISIYELFEHDNQVVLVMEWIDGKNLKEIIHREGQISLAQLTSWMIDICDGLDHAHQKGIIHRDIKSSNLMISQNGKAKLGDFGLAKSLGILESRDNLTADGVLIGTLDYMSPEQVRGEKLDYRTDLFSLGVVMFEALTGRLPFHREKPAETLSAIMYEPCPDLEVFQIPEAERINEILKSLLSKNIEGRFSTAGELRTALIHLGKEKKSFFSRFGIPLSRWR